MIVRRFESHPFAIKLKRPFKNSNTEISKRRGFIIRITDELGNIGYGEASPLPGSSKETFEEIIPVVKDMGRRLIGSELDSDVFQSLEKYPSVQFGVSQALHSIFILRDGFNPQWNINPTISVNGIIGMTEKNEAVKRVKKLISDGFRTIKIKVGREEIDDDLGLVKTLSKDVGNDIKFRLDVNGKWDVDKTQYAIGHLRNMNVEYIEQPVKNFDELKEVSKNSKIPIAADESIRSIKDIERMLAETNIQYFVLKPSIMGGITETINIIRLIEAAKRKAVISSAFESSIGRSALTFIASLVNKELSHGLAVASYFSNDIADDPYPVVNGEINFDKKSYPPKFNIAK